MRTQGIKPGDIVHCDVRGQKFYAVIKEKTDDGFGLDKLTSQFLPAYVVKPRQIVGHYSKRKGST
jgi:hypothetical protein